MQRPRLALVPGEPAGVGPELCVRLAQAPRDHALTVFADPRSLRAAALVGLSVPRDLSVVGFDGIALGRDLTPVLSTVAQPAHELGRLGARRLLDSLAGTAPAGPVETVVGTRLVVRRTTARRG